MLQKSFGDAGATDANGNGSSKNQKRFIDETTLLSVTNMTKTFGAVTALDKVDLTLFKGEILGLIGENGSGKSTVTSIISGMQKADAGEMMLNGQSWQPQSMIDAMNRGVGMIVQESGVINGISIAENISLGEIGKFAKGGFLTSAKANKKAREVLESVGVTDFDVTMPVGALDLQDRKIIEIAKVWAKSPDILVVDETTTAVSQRGRKIIYQLVNEQKAKNKSVIFISHDLDEIMLVCGRVTVLRDGHIIQSLDKADFDVERIKQLMIGRELKGDYYRSEYGDAVNGPPVLRAERLTNHVLCDVSLEVKSGEVLGIGGMSHCGMHDLGKVLFGAEKAKGSVTVLASSEKIKSEAAAMRNGIGYASKDRDLEAVILDAPIRDNIVSAGLNKLAHLNFFVLPREEKRYSKKQVDALSIKCHTDKQYVSTLSGGNKQKVVIGKWLGAESEIFILDCPTRGIDIGVKQAMYQLMYKLRNQGKSIVMISEELAELIGMSDRILIMKNGGITKEFERTPELSESDIIDYMV
jgi:ribose transport system ATP-binding protein